MNLNLKSNEYNNQSRCMPMPMAWGVVTGGLKGRRRVGGDEIEKKIMVPDSLAGSDMAQRRKVKSDSGAR